MKLKLIYFITMIFISGISQVYSQSDPQVSQTWMQPTIFNPASIGATDALNINGYVRQQYSGFNNAPATQYLGINNYFKSIHLGIGLAFTNDHFGIENSQNLKVQLTHRIKINEETDLTFGLAGGILHHHIETSNLVFEDGNDPLSDFPYESETKPDFDFGAVLRYKNFRAGLSCLHLTNSTKNSTVFRTPRHYYIYGNYQLLLNERLTLIPGIYFKKSGPVTQAGISTIIDYDNRFAGGLSYRVNDALSLMARIEIVENIFIGYTYDIDSGPIKSYSSGSHEIMFNVRINKGSGILKTPRFFD